MSIVSSIQKHTHLNGIGVLLWVIGVLCGVSLKPVAAQPEQAPQQVVTNTKDAGEGSLRQAMRMAQATPETVIVFRIPKTDENFKDGVFTILLERTLPSIRTDGTVIDGTTQTAFSGDTNPAGPEIVLKSALSSRELTGGINDVCIHISARNCAVRSLTIQHYHHAILISGRQAPGNGSGNEVQGCYIGTTATGDAFPADVKIPPPVLTIRTGANNNVIGGTTPGSRNVITYLAIFNEGTVGNIIQGNYIGVSADGEKALGPSGGMHIGQGASRNLVGGTTPAARNVMAGHGNQGNAIVINGEGTDENIVQGNYIGTNKDGTKYLSTSPFGVFINAGPKNNVIGGTTPEARNVIANHPSGAVLITFASGNIIQGNYAGLDATGTKALGERTGPTIEVARGNTVGTEGAARNITPMDVRTAEAPAAAPPATGAPAPVAAPAPAPAIGPVPVVPPAPIIPAAPVEDAPKIVVNTTADTGPGSLRQALQDAQNAPGSMVVFNIPNTDAGFKDGVFTIQVGAYLPNIKANGTIIDGSTQTAFTGDTNPLGPEVQLRSGKDTPQNSFCLWVRAARCVIKSLAINSEPGKIFRLGIRISGAEASENRVIGCYIGTDATGMTVQGNDGGIRIEGGAHHNIIGGPNEADRNVISGNRGAEIFVGGVGSDYNFIQGNYLGVGADGKKAMRNNGGVNISEGAKNNVIGGPLPEGATGSTRNIICSYGEQSSAVVINVRGTDNNFVQGNYLGTDKDGTTVLSTSLFGVMVNAHCRNNLIGGTTPETRNVIANHQDAAITITFCSNTFVQGNYIGVDPSGTKLLGIGNNGIAIYASASNVIGGAEPGAGNLINGNSGNAISLSGDPGAIETTNNIVQGNIIGADATGKASPGPQRIGVGIYGVCYNNTIGLALDGSGRGNMIIFHAAKPADGSTTLPMQGGILVEADDKGKATGNTIRGNVLYGNGGLGINLRLATEGDNIATPNDANDADGGPNNGQNFPTITSVTTVAGKTVVKGALRSTPNTEFLIDLYRSSIASASGFGEGEMIKAFARVTTNAAGIADFTISPYDETGGDFFTVTATNTATGDTSEFSPAVTRTDVR